jgi:hypothetical protein
MPALQNVVDHLKAVRDAGGGYDDFVDAFSKLGRIAAQR